MIGGHSTTEFLRTVPDEDAAPRCGAAAVVDESAHILVWSLLCDLSKFSTKMTPPHSASTKSHSYVTQELVKNDYLVSAYDRFPCDLTGARTSRFQWINVGVRQSDDGTAVPPIECIFGLLDEPIPFGDCLLPLSSNTLAGPLVPGDPPMLLLSRLATSFILGQY